MKIKNIVSLFKKRKQICMHTDCHGLQWIGDGMALYPLHNLPVLNSDEIFNLFDIPEDKRAEYIVRQDSDSISYSLEDCDSETEIEEISAFSINRSGAECIPFKSEQGMLFIDNQYMSPLLDIMVGLHYFIRYTSFGQPYIAVKAGMILTAIILPKEIIDDNFIGLLRDLIYQCEVYRNNARIREPKPEADIPSDSE